MDPLLIISPHLDDAVLSCGRLMAGRPDVIVASMFTGNPAHPARVLTTYDESSGFPNAGAAMKARREEDYTALGKLRASALHLGMVDGQYDDRPLVERLDPIRDRIGYVLDLVPDAPVLVPVGIAHPDHELVACAAHAELEGSGREAWIYEELPARVLWPEQALLRMEWWRALWNVEAGFLGTGPLDVKVDALQSYASQLGPLAVVDEGLHASLCPERFHRLWPIGGPDA